MAKQRQTVVNIDFKSKSSEIEQSNKLLLRANKATDDLRNSIDKTKSSADKAGSSLKNAGSDGAKSFATLNNILKTVSFTIIANEILSFTKKVIAIRGEFQKFEAVLTNTLGSKSSALIALAQINEFAKSTPFSVRELTESFIKLANRGIQPTIKQMRAIGDLSATLGKDFSQVVEAILDINNPERWKEIGIKAETAGDKVKLTFRGVTQEVNRTVEGVTGAVVALGQLNGVAGSTEAISRTLSGQVSNLGDAWDQLLNTIGTGNQGVLFEAVSLLSKGIEKANELIKGPAQKFQELESKTLAAETEGFKSLVKAFGDVDKAKEAFTRKTQDRINELNASFGKIRATLEKAPLIDITGSNAGIDARNKVRQTEMTRLASLIDIYMDALPKAIDETIGKMGEQGKAEIVEAGIVEKLEEKIKDLNKQIKETNRLGDLGAKGKLITALKAEQDKLDKLLGKPDKEAEKEDKDKAKREEENAKRSLALQKYFLDLKDKKNKEADADRIAQLEDLAKKELDIEKDKEKKKADLRQLTRQLAEEFVTNSLHFLFTKRDEDLTGLQNYYDNQIALAGDNARAKKEIEIKRDREVAKAQERAKERDKDNARNQIAIDGLIAIAKIFGEFGWPAGIIPSAIMAGITAVNIAQVGKYREGGWIKGPGSETSDSIPILASRNEFMVNAANAKKSPKLLEQVNSGKLNDRMLRDIMSGRSGGSSTAAVDLTPVVNGLRELKDAQPDLVLRANTVYEGRKRGDRYRQWIRSKSMNS